MDKSNTSVYELNGRCLKVTPIANCDSYSDTADACKQCLDGFYYDAENKACTALPATLTNCVRGQKDKDSPIKCISCSPLYALTNGNCVRADNVVNSNCETVVRVPVDKYSYALRCDRCAPS